MLETNPLWDFLSGALLVAVNMFVKERSFGYSLPQRWYGKLTYPSVREVLFFWKKDD